MKDGLLGAFGTLDARADALGDGVVRDRISLREYVLSADIGAFQSERGQPQRLRFDVVVDIAEPPATMDDDVDRILSYDTLTEAIGAALQEGRVNLLETLAERVAQRVLGTPKAGRVFVRVQKLDRGPFALGVEIVRDRGDGTALDDLPVPAPRIAVIAPEVISGPELPELIEALAKDTATPAVVLPCAVAQGPVSAVSPAQRRIDLLAIEQAAWVLAGRDPRCIVVNSRTELDWALRRGQLTVWAPSKMVLDAAKGQGPAGIDPAALALWLASELSAAEVLWVGPAPAAGLPKGIARVDPRRALGA